MPYARLKPLPVLEAVEDFRLQTDLAPRVHGIVKNDGGKDRSDREFHRTETCFLPDNHEERSNERRVAARESSGMEESIVINVSFFGRCNCKLRKFAEYPDDEGDEEDVDGQNRESGGGHGRVC